MNNDYVVIVDTIDASKAEERYQSVLDAVTRTKLIVINVEVTSLCNLNCDYCGMHGKANAINAKSKTTMSYSKLKEIVDKCIGMPIMSTFYFGGHGEPLLNKDLVLMVSYVKKHKIAEKIAITTNGILLSSDLFQSLCTAGVDEVRVSYDIFSPDIYKKSKGSSSSLTVRKNIEDCVKVLNSNSITNLTIECKNWVAGSSERNNETECIIDYFRHYKDITDKFKIRIIDEFEWNMNKTNNINRIERTTACEQPFYMIQIHADGDVSCCCLDVSKELIIGNVNSVDKINHILGHDRMVNIRKKLLNQDYANLSICHSCNKYSCIDSLLVERKHEILKCLINTSP